MTDCAVVDLTRSLRRTALTVLRVLDICARTNRMRSSIACPNSNPRRPTSCTARLAPHEVVIRRTLLRRRGRTLPARPRCAAVFSHPRRRERSTRMKKSAAALPSDKDASDHSVMTAMLPRNRARRTAGSPRQLCGGAARWLSAACAAVWARGFEPPTSSALPWFASARRSEERAAGGTSRTRRGSMSTARRSFEHSSAPTGAVTALASLGDPHAERSTTFELRTTTTLPCRATAAPRRRRSDRPRLVRPWDQRRSL